MGLKRRRAFPLHRTEDRSRIHSCVAEASVAVFTMAGCYAIIETGPATEPTAKDRPWGMSFAYRLVPLSPLILEVPYDNHHCRSRR